MSISMNYFDNLLFEILKKWINIYYNIAMNIYLSILINNYI